MPARYKTRPVPFDWKKLSRCRNIVYSRKTIHKQATIVISPAENFSMGLGSDARRRVISKFLLHVPPSERRRWVAGHLINADFGGRGDSECNITPLTAHANHMHYIRVEKVAAENQRQIYQYFNDVRVKRYASVLVRQVYEVTLSGKPGLYGSASALSARIYFEVNEKKKGIWEGWKTHFPCQVCEKIRKDSKKIADQAGEPVALPGVLKSVRVTIPNRY